MKKKVFSLVLCLVMCASVLAGCNLFGTDWEKYYNEVVATINYDYVSGGITHTESVDITKRELINAYNSYGYNYEESYDYTREQAINMTLETVINRKLMAKDVERTAEDNGEPLFNDAEKTYLWEETYDALLDNLYTYYEDIIGETSVGGEEAEEESTGTIFEEYDKLAVLHTETDTNGNKIYEIRRYNATSKTSGSNHVLSLNSVNYDMEYQDSEGNFVFKDLIYSYFESLTSASSNWRASLNQYLSDVRDNYNYMTFSDDEEVFMFELNRIYDIVKENYLVDKYTEIHNNLERDGSTDSNIRADAMLSYYEGLWMADYEKYVNHASTFQTDILSESTTVDYVYSGANTYFNVGVIKIDLTAELEELEGKLYNEIDEGEYQKQKEQLFENASVEIKDSTNGVATGKTISAKSLLEKIKTTLNGTRSYGADALVNQQIAYEKADAFVDYLYYYNDDSTYLNTDKMSAFGLSSTGEVLYNTTFSSAQNDAFDQAIRDLYNNGNAKVGDLSSLVYGEDGVYILFYAGKVENVLTNVKDAGVNLTDLEIMARTRVNIFNTKTIFDLCYDALYNEALFDTFQEEHIIQLQNELTREGDGITTYPDAYKDLTQN